MSMEHSRSEPADTAQTGGRGHSGLPAANLRLRTTPGLSPGDQDARLQPADGDIPDSRSRTFAWNYSRIVPWRSGRKLQTSGRGHSGLPVANLRSKLLQDCPLAIRTQTSNQRTGAFRTSGREPSLENYSRIVPWRLDPKRAVRITSIAPASASPQGGPDTV